MTDDLLWPRWFRVAVIALATCILCSCQSLPRSGTDRQTAGDFQTAAVPPRRSELAPHVGPGGGFDGQSPCEDGRTGCTPACAPALPGGPPYSTCDGATPCYGQLPPAECPGADPWRPPGIAAPWPPNEYLCDGGDGGPRITVRADRTIGPLDLEDTVAHYEAADGRTMVVPSNRVCVYAPRFASVRRVDSPSLQETHAQVRAMGLPEQLSAHARRQLATTTLQRLQPRGELGARAGSVYRGRQQGGGLDTRVRLAAVDEALMPYERFQIIRLGEYDQSEKARLAQAVVAAIVWTHDQAVQVILDGRRADVATRDSQVEVVYRVDEPDNPRLRVVKIASTSTAKPGETVDFTIRYDNIGDQTIRTVTLLDNLTTRLEFVPGSARASAPCDFSTAANEGGSLLLRWDFADPLQPGAGGTVRFRCKVR